MGLELSGFEVVALLYSFTDAECFSGIRTDFGDSVKEGPLVQIGKYDTKTP